MDGCMNAMKGMVKDEYIQGGIHVGKETDTEGYK